MLPTKAIPVAGLGINDSKVSLRSEDECRNKLPKSIAEINLPKGGFIVDGQFRLPRDLPETKIDAGVFAEGVYQRRESCRRFYRR